jgi:serine/threonine-protein kinase
MLKGFEELIKLGRRFIRTVNDKVGGARAPVSAYECRLKGQLKAKEPLVGTLVAKRYFLLSILGKGGMSVVYKAKDRLKRRILAVKTLRYQWADDGLTVKRFQREAQALSLLRHPAIVGIYDYGETRSGQPFFVMDHLTGSSLAEVLKAQTFLPVKRVRQIFRQVFDAVHHAHNAGLVHRDLKPGNIMLVESDSQGDVVKIVDFGIAKLQQEAQKLTRLGEVWGSPVYMSPEQCQGSTLDKRSDVYSLGVCLFESLSGQLPFFGKNYFETMTMQINEPPPSIRQVRPDLLFNEELDLVLSKALAKDPEQRFQSVKDFKIQMEEAIEKLLPSSKNKRTLEVVVRKPGSAMRNSQTAQAAPQSTSIASNSNMSALAKISHAALQKISSARNPRQSNVNIESASQPRSNGAPNGPPPKIGSATRLPNRQAEPAESPERLWFTLLFMVTVAASAAAGMFFVYSLTEDKSIGNFSRPAPETQSQINQTQTNQPDLTQPENATTEKPAEETGSVKAGSPNSDSPNQR